MSANNPFGKGSNKSGKNDASGDRADAAARRLQQESGGNRSGIGQRRGKPAPKPGVERSSGGTGSNPTTPRLPKDRPSLPRGGTGGSAARRGCGLPVGLLALVLLVGGALITRG